MLTCQVTFVDKGNAQRDTWYYFSYMANRQIELDDKLII